MISEELLNKMAEHYIQARQLAKEIWITMDNEGNQNDYYYFECGFISALKYNLDGSFRDNTTIHPNQQDQVQHNDI
jgi:hypothetical protein